MYDSGELVVDRDRQVIHEKYLNEERSNKI